MDIRQLRTLKAIHDTGSLVAAAERLHLTQSALSHQLRELEAEVDAVVLIRKTRPPRFTQIGERLLALETGYARPSSFWVYTRGGFLNLFGLSRTPG